MWDKIMYVVQIDSKGRIVIPKEIRERLGLTSGKRLKIVYTNGKIVLEPIESVAEKYYGLFKVNKPLPENLDEFAVRVVEKWWRERM